MSRLAQCFSDLARQGRKALIPFVTAGDPEPSVTVPLMHAMVAAGADIVEIGVPFSDPMAEGPVIQRACERALVHGTGLRDVLAMIATFRQQDVTTPVVLMGYLNPIEIMGYGEFARTAHEAGVDGVITVDLPPEDAGDYIEALRGQALDTIFLASPTTSDERLVKLAGHARGFVYYVSLKGVTGAGSLAPEQVGQRIGQIKAQVDLPVVVGFGIRDAATAAHLARVADGVVVGSRLVQIVAENETRVTEIAPRIGEQVHAMRVAMDDIATIDTDGAAG